MDARTHDLGQFEGFNFRSQCAIAKLLSAEEVLEWDHDKNGEAEFWPDGSNFFVSKLLPRSSCCADEIRESPVYEPTTRLPTYSKAHQQDPRTPDTFRWQYTGNKLHPTQKLVSVLTPLVEKFCPPHGIVLDLFCGSGSSLLAARIAARSFIGIKSKAVTEAAARRLENPPRRSRIEERVPLKENKVSHRATSAPPHARCPPHPKRASPVARRANRPQPPLLRLLSRPCSPYLRERSKIVDKCRSSFSIEWAG
jgi:hypothetical protein